MKIHLDPTSTISSLADIDECTLNMNNCADDAACMDSDGSFTCTCDTGYIGDGVTCTGRSMFYVEKYVSLKQYHRVNVFGTDNIHVLQILMSALEQMIVTLMQTV